jgi:hypothetical protein
MSEKLMKGFAVTKDKKQNWLTMLGTFQTEGNIKTKFKLPKLNSLTEIDYKFHVTHSLGVYDMIIGCDIMQEIGLIIDFANEQISWKENDREMKSHSCTKNDSFNIKDPKGQHKLVGQLAGNNYKNIMEAKYEKADIKKQIQEKCSYLNSKQPKALIALLKKYKHLFNVMLGTWKHFKCKIELKEGVKPYHSHPYSTPRA